MKESHKNSQGIILISVLIVMNLIIFLVLIGLQTSEFEMKMSQNYYLSLKSF